MIFLIGLNYFKGIYCNLLMRSLKFGEEVDFFIRLLGIF